LPNTGKTCLINGHSSTTIRDTSEQNKSIIYADPWIRRCDQPSSIDYVCNQEQQQQQERQKSIQYETRLYYHSLSPTSDEHLSQQQQQPLLSTIDKDIEYVESRLRGQTTVSLPTSQSAHYTHDGSWRRFPRQKYMNVLSPSSNDPQQSTQLVHQKYPNTTNIQPINETTSPCSKSITPKSAIPISINTNGSVKTVKSRMEKMKDQKAAKTLR